MLSPDAEMLGIGYIILPSERCWTEMGVVQAKGHALCILVKEEGQGISVKPTAERQRRVIEGDSYRK
jgi:hypothetical protein